MNKRVMFNLKYLNLLVPWNNIFNIVSRRKKVGEYKGITFVIHANESCHNKGHIHVKYQEKEVSISIPEAEIIDGNLPPKQMGIARNWVRGNVDYLISNWNDFTKGIKIPAI